MILCLRDFVLQSDWYRQIRVPQVERFSRKCYTALPPPLYFEEQGLERERERMEDRRNEEVREEVAGVYS